MAKAKKKTKKRGAKKAARKAPRKTKRKAAKRTRKTATGTCKVVTVCGRRRKLCFKKKGNRIVIASNTAA